MKFYIGILSALFIASCSTVTVLPTGKHKVTGQPTWESSEPFFLAGLVGQGDIDVTKPCGGQEPTQVQTQDTFVDGLLTVVTFTIYSPRTVKVWCPKGAM